MWEKEDDVILPWSRKYDVKEFPFLVLMDPLLLLYYLTYLGQVKESEFLIAVTSVLYNSMSNREKIIYTRFPINERDIDYRLIIDMNSFF